MSLVTDASECAPPGQRIAEMQVAWYLLGASDCPRNKPDRAAGPRARPSVPPKLAADLQVT